MRRPKDPNCMAKSVEKKARGHVNVLAVVFAAPVTVVVRHRRGAVRNHRDSREHRAGQRVVYRATNLMPIHPGHEGTIIRTIVP